MNTQSRPGSARRVPSIEGSGLSRRRVSTLAFLTSLGIAPAAFAAGPTTEEWSAAEAGFQPLLQGGVGLADPVDDVATTRDLVGSADDPVAYVYNDGTWFYARVRLDSDPRGAGGVELSPFGWGVLIHNDADDPCYLQFNYSLMVDGISEQIEWAQNDTTGIQEPNTYPCDRDTCTNCPNTLGDPSESAELLLNAYETDYVEDANGFNVRITTLTAPPFGGDDDYFLDFAVPYSALLDAGIVPSDPLTFWVGSSNNARSISVDLASTPATPGPGLLSTTASDITGASGGAACTTDADCGGSTPACHTTTSVCVECTATNTAQCSGETSACEIAISACVPCTESATCSCTPPATVCVALDGDGDELLDREERLAGTDPNDADSDNDGVADGDEPSWDTDVDGDGLIGALDADSDNDGLFDGTEMGEDCDGPGTDASAGSCTPDADGGATETDPDVADTDGGGVSDGAEDVNLDGAVDSGELNPNVGDDDSGSVDTDGDGLSDDLEDFLGSDPADGDSDDDGLPDGEEANPASDTDADDAINILDPDSDGDGLFDGMEAGNDCSSAATGAATCVADADPLTTTGVLAADTDGGGIADGEEDENGNGAVDATESDPNYAPDDVCSIDSQCGVLYSGSVCDATTGACVTGCRAEGGNGCPVGETCTSTGAEIGSCVTGAGGGAGTAGTTGAAGATTGGAGGLAGAAGASPAAGQGGVAPNAGAGGGPSAGGPSAGAPGAVAGAAGASRGGSGGVIRNDVVAKGDGLLCTASPATARRASGASWLVLLAGAGVLLRRRAQRRA